MVITFTSTYLIATRHQWHGQPNFSSMAFNQPINAKVIDTKSSPVPKTPCIHLTFFLSTGHEWYQFYWLPFVDHECWWANRWDATDKDSAVCGCFHVQEWLTLTMFQYNLSEYILFILSFIWWIFIFPSFWIWKIYASHFSYHTMISCIFSENWFFHYKQLIYCQAAS